MNKKEAKKILYETFGNYIDKENELLFSCPACDHHKRKFSVNLDKNAYKCWVCDYRGRNIRRAVRRFGSFTQLQKWDEITNRTDLERFADLFMEDKQDTRREKDMKYAKLKSNGRLVFVLAGNTAIGLLYLHLTQMAIVATL